MALTVTAVNDLPVNTVPGAQTVTEDTALSLGGISVADVEGIATVQLGVPNGTVTVTLSGGAMISAGANGTGTLTVAGSQAAINATLATLAYQGTLNYNGPDTLTVTSTDGKRDRCGHGGAHGDPGERCAGEHGAGGANGERGYGACARRHQRHGCGRQPEHGAAGRDERDGDGEPGVAARRSVPARTARRR